MSIPQAIIDQILDRIDLVDLIHSRVPLKKSGKSYTACCPFHQESTPSFHVHRDKAYYHCFGCQANGNAIKFLMEYERRDFIDVLKDLAQQAGVELPERNPEAARAAKEKLSYKRNTAKPNAPPSAEPPKPDQPTSLDAPMADFSGLDDYYQSRPDETDSDPYWEFEDTTTPNESKEGNLYSLVEQVAQFYESQLDRYPAARAYAQRRGLDEAACKTWRIGYAPDHATHLMQRFPQDIEGLKKIGLIRTTESGRDYVLLRDRLIFTIRDHKGRVVGFGGRAMRDDVKPKYINSPESEIFYKNQLLYGLYESHQAKASQWLMVEGYMDVIALHQAGFPGAVAALGTAANVDHLQTLFKQSQSITLAFDGDSAGQRAAWRTLELALPILEDGRELRFLVLPPDQDPDSLVRLEGATGLKKRIEEAPLLSDFLFDVLAMQYKIDTPEGKSRMLFAAQNLINMLPRGHYRSIFYLNIRTRLGLVWQDKTVSTTSSSFQDHSTHSLDMKTLLLLMHYPEHVDAFEVIEELRDPRQIIGLAIRLISQLKPMIPQNPDEAFFFLLGAWPDDDQRSKILEFSNIVNVHELFPNPDDLTPSNNLALQFKARALRLQSQMAQSTEEAQKLLKIGYQVHRLRANIPEETKFIRLHN